MNKYKYISTSANEADEKTEFEKCIGTHIEGLFDPVLCHNLRLFLRLIERLRIVLEYEERFLCSYTQQFPTFVPEQLQVIKLR